MLLCCSHCVCESSLVFQLYAISILTVGSIFIQCKICNLLNSCLVCNPSVSVLLTFQSSHSPPYCDMAVFVSSRNVCLSVLSVTLCWSSGNHDHIWHDVLWWTPPHWGSCVARVVTIIYGMMFFGGRLQIWVHVLLEW